MTKDPITNLPASVHQRLLNLDPARTHDFTPVLRRYAFERWLYRLGKSDHAESFVVKGAMLFVLWTSDLPRTTMDLDLLGIDTLTEAGLRRVFSRIGRMKVEPDGLTFEANNIAFEPIRDEAEYHGLRVKFMARLGDIRIPLQVDIGIGGSVWPEPEYVLYPTLLDMPAPRIRVYRKETTIAEKLDAMLELGILNSRMKDFYDIAVLGDLFSFSGTELQRAVLVSLKLRKLTSLSELPVAFTDEFAQDKDKNIQWGAFLRRIGKSSVALPLQQVVIKIRNFLLPVLQALNARTEFNEVWEPGGPWRRLEKDHDG
ncbi:MAG: nucleotidyl transferase AbiEii/AbiGii toxin family protein [Candidatus Aminicenantes bacterium]|nr:nucleotidyl transferase AbiEii/AbiGii toxin family protein [Candidatus Aminicenantes bacterium]